MNKKYLLKIKKRLLLYSTVMLIAIILAECSNEIDNTEEKQKVLRKEESYENNKNR